MAPSREVVTTNCKLSQGDSKGEAVKLVIALDFGTTFSGVAYAFTSQASSVYNVEEWPGAKGRTSPKVPTLVKYQDSNIKWGFEVDRTLQGLIEAIKLRLDPDQPQPLFVPAADTDAELTKLGITAEQVTTVYIREIFQHAMASISGKYPSGYIDMVEKIYVLTVPAIWSEKAMDATKRAAAAAKIAPVTLIKEPEAAALFTLRQMGDKGLSIGDAFVLCDAGGGTIDLISYEITSLSPFELKELTSASGSMAGSFVLNRRFEETIRGIVGDEAFVKLKGTDAYRRAMKSFEEDIKPGFVSKNDKDEYVCFPKANIVDNPAKGLAHNTLTVTGKTLHGIFEPVLRDILKQIEEQVMHLRMRRMKEKHENAYEVKAIFLVGGFGSNKYLYDRVTAANQDIQVIQPNDAWSAVVRGAVMSQLQNDAKVTVNFAPKHYGVSCSMPWDPVRDLGKEEDKFWDPYENCHRVNAMTWYINKGNSLARTHVIAFPFYRAYPHKPSKDQLRFTESTLYECRADHAPAHPDHADITQNVCLKSDLSQFPSSAIVKRTRQQDNATILQWWEIHYSLRVTVGSGPMMFSIVCNGKEYGTAKAEY